MSKAIYDKVHKYHVHAECVEPLHVGSASGDKSEVLIRPVDQMPFVQATSICGIIRSYCEKLDQSAADDLFGTRENHLESRVRISDGEFVKSSEGKNEKKPKLELRPRLRLNNASGTVAANVLKGETEIASGQKLEMQYIAAGAEIDFDIFVYNETDSEGSMIQKCLAAFNEGEIQLGGQKSNGCGYIGNLNVLHKVYDMTKADDRKSWIAEEDNLEKLKLPELDSFERLKAYDITISASTEGELLVKGIAVDTFGEDAPKAVNLKNGEGKYIIPGSSIKGAVRNRMEMIAKYKGIPDSLVEDAFGKSSDGEVEGKIGNLKFRDIVIDKEHNENLRTRIRVDKFTGGVINGGLFSELTVYGDLNIRISIAAGNHADAVLALLLLALRDLGCKLYTLGSGQNVGRGYVDIQKVEILDYASEESSALTDDAANKPQTNSDNSGETVGMKECVLDGQFQAVKGKELVDFWMAALQNQLVESEGGK